MRLQRLRRLENLVERLAAVLRQQPAAQPRQLQTAQDVIELLHEQIETIRFASYSDAVKQGRAIGYLANLARQAIETGDLAARLEKLEASLEQRTMNQARQR